tara:strand:+ start:397 stop:870 length:474 start_codon:yes stop_codon:yes gene_type:complete
MNITDAETLCLLHMEEHGLMDKLWYFEFEDCKTSLGRCHYTEEKITLSKWYVELNEEKDVEDTILHEIAHALSFLKYGKKGTGHGVLWKQMCRKIGAKPNRIHQGVIEYPNNHYKYSSTCCGHTWGMHRMGKGRRYLCPKCDKRLVFKTRKKTLTYT